MNKARQRINFFLIGHRINFNWLLLILLAWVSLITIGVTTKEDLNSNNCPVSSIKGNVK